MRIVPVGLLILFTTIPCLGQTGSTVKVHTGVPQNIYDLAPTMVLIPKGAGAHPGQIWVRSTDEGLHIWGKVQVNDDDLHWPQEKSEMLSKDHVEIWLSAATSVKMPPIGYGNQFGEIDFNSVADCAPVESNGGPGNPRSPDVKGCERWYNEQVEYRKLFERLFTRQWLAAGTDGFRQTKSYFEAYATSAYSGMNAAFFDQELPKALEPKGSDGIVSEFNKEFGKPEMKANAHEVPDNTRIVTGYAFHFLIPWSAFPPAQQLELRDLWLTVDVFGSAPEGKKMGALSTTSAQRVWGKPSSFNHLVLDTARIHEITPCAAAETETDMYGNPHPIWYFPMAGKGRLDLSTVDDIENPAGGYMYNPGGVSPIFSANEHFWKILPDGAAVCGPELAYRKGAITQRSANMISNTYFATKTLPDGWTLVRTGPDMSTQSPFGSGACGACPVVNFHIYVISPMGEITPALDINEEFSGMEGSAADGDFDIAPDWQRVIYYENFITFIGDGRGGQKENWTATSYCLEGHKYKPCGEQKNVKPPDPRNFQLED
jgi:hypothetical protein